MLHYRQMKTLHVQQSHYSGLHSFRPKYSPTETRQVTVDVDRAWIKQKGLKGIFPFSFRESPINHHLTFNQKYCIMA